MAGCDVFISYKRGDGDGVEPIARKLKELGLEVWYDTRLEAGPSFDEQIAAKLRSAKAVLVCWTPAAIASEWVRGEAAMAHEAGKLVACFLKPTKLIPPFNLFQTENLADWDGEDDHAGWAKTLTRIASLSDRTALIEWAALMSDGDPKVLRTWAAKQAPGPIRVTTRFWISELDGATVAIPDAALTSAKRRTFWNRWRRLKWWQHGLVVLASVVVLGATFLTSVWLFYQPQMAAYDVVFEGPTQFSRGSDVKFNGINVGSVQSLLLDREDPNRVIARILIDPQTPIRMDSVAQQMLDRSTGGIYVLIRAGDPAQPLLIPQEFQPPPRILTERTMQDEIDLGQQDLLAVQGDLYNVQREYYSMMIEELQKKRDQEAATEPAKVDAPDSKPPASE